MAVITLTEYKTLAGISGTDQDAKITAIIPMVQSDIVEMCNYDFNQNTAEEDFPAGLKLYAMQMISFQAGMASANLSLKSESIDGYSYSRADMGESGYPASIEKGIKSKWGRVSSKITQPRTTFRDRRGMGVESISRDPPTYYNPGVPIGDSE